MQLAPLSTHWAPRKKTGSIFFGHPVYGNTLNKNWLRKGIIYYWKYSICKSSRVTTSALYVDFIDFTQAYLAKVGEWLDIWNNRKYRTAASCHIFFFQFKVHKSLQNQDFQYVEDLDEYIIKQINKDEIFRSSGMLRGGG